MSSVIEVQGLSKSFTIHHEGRERYTALRDVVANRAKKVFSFPKSLKAVSASSAFNEEFWALKDVSFQIEQGDRVGIIGRNGAGKSTLLKILSRITEPTKGSVKIRGRVASLLEVGTGFHPELTGRENIFLNGAILGMSRAEIKKKFDEIVDFAEVEKFLDTPVKRYSSGMYVRLAFAVAAHLEPEILVVDEVLAVGDAQFQKKCLGKMEEVSSQFGRTVLFVSHNLSAVSSLCKKGLLLERGEITCFSKIVEVLSAYINDSEKLKVDGSFSKSFDSKWWINNIYIEQNNIATKHLNGNDPIDFHIEFEGKEDRKISFELLFKDSNHQPIFYVPLGIGQNINFDCGIRKYHLQFSLVLPKLALDKYFIDLFIVESFVERIACLNDILSFEVISSFVTETGWNFDKIPGIGSLMGKTSNYSIKAID